MDVKKRQLEHVKRMRELIASENLVLFIGEGLSALGDDASLDDWWKLVEDDRLNHDRVLEKEDAYLKSLPERRSKALDNIRGLGRFPLILTTNLDSLIERILSVGSPRFEVVRLDQAHRLMSRSLKKRNVVVKCFGDSSLATEITVDSKQLMFDLCEGKERNNYAQQFLTYLFNEKSVLFLGCNPNHQLYKNLFQRFVKPAKAKHYLYQRGTERAEMLDGSLATLQLDMPLEEFTLNLSTGSAQADFGNGKSWEKFYLPSQRKEYLQQQLSLEQRSSKITFLTATITNALATDEVLEKVNRPKLESLFDNDPFVEKNSEAVEEAFEAMLKRRNNLLKIIEEGQVPVRAMFLLEEFRREISTGSDDSRKMMIKKYADAALKCNSFLHSKSSFEIILIPTKDKSDLDYMKKETFAFLNLKGDTADAAVCYAAQASGAGKKSITTNLIDVNGEKVQARSKLIDQTLARAMSPEESLVKLVGLLLQEDRKIGGAIKEEKIKKLEQLDQMLGLTEGNEIDLMSLENIGSGSFGDVYKGQLKGRTVAFKVIKERGSEADLNAFLREFEALKNAQHPNIVQVENCFRSKLRFGLVMEYVEGCNLWNIICENPLSRDNAHKVAVAVACALDHLHRMKIIHRDVKPDNILIGHEFDVIKLSDFGLARAMESTLESKTVLRGHWRYMAPEVMDSKKYTTKADVYSYGCTLIETVSGKKVFEDMATNQLGVHRGMIRPRIPINCIEKYGVEMRHAIELAIRPEKTRASIEDILDVLREKELRKLAAKENPLAIFCLGTGTGTTGIFTEEASSSFVLLHYGNPLLWVDVGFGVTRQYRRYFDIIPSKIFITHNHGDHSAELPTLLYLDACRRLKDRQADKVTIYSGLEVERNLKERRLHEHIEAELPNGSKVDSPIILANWQTCSLENRVYLDVDRYISIKVFKSQHSQTCYGFVLFWNTRPLLGFTGDSGFNEELYANLSIAPYIIVDARKNGNKDHASFEDVMSYFKDKGCEEVFVTGYGTLFEKPELPAGFTAFESGSKYVLKTELAKKENIKEQAAKYPSFLAESETPGYPSLDETLSTLSSK